MAAASIQSNFVPQHADDTHDGGPWITSIVSTPDERIVMADKNNGMVKIASGDEFTTILAVSLPHRPWALALLHDGLVAVTSDSKYLYLVDVSGHPSVVSRVETARQYWGVSSGTTPDTLIVSCDEDGDGPAKIDLITREGVFIRTVIDSGTLQAKSELNYLCRLGQHVIVSDWLSKVYRIDIATGIVIDKLHHMDLKGPRQIASDGANNLYFACSVGSCVLFMSADDREWRRLVEGGPHGGEDYVVPDGVCVTGSRLFVAWRHHSGSIVTVFELPDQ